MATVLSTATFLYVSTGWARFAFGLGRWIWIVGWAPGAGTGLDTNPAEPVDMVKYLSQWATVPDPVAGVWMVFCAVVRASTGLSLTPGVADTVRQG